MQRKTRVGNGRAWQKRFVFGLVPFAIAIFLINLGLRFWQLGQFNTLVFDEVYYAKFANNYLIGQPFFNSHPPLSQYFIALGMAIASGLPSDPAQMNTLSGSLRSPLSYRWMNALLGSGIPLVLGAIAYQLSRRRSTAAIAMLLATLDGLLLVESRYALNNIYLVLFGLLGQYFFLTALREGRGWSRSGLCFGMAAAAKWNGLGFLLGSLLWWAIARSLALRLARQGQVTSGLWRDLQAVSVRKVLIYLLFIPAATYSLLWIPHLLMNPQYDFWEVHRQIWIFHHKIGSGRSTHAYCSPWYSWLLMVRPMAYYYRPQITAAGKIVRDVHAMGNPLLWWFSTLALAATLVSVLWQGIGRRWRDRLRYWQLPNSAIATFLLSSYLANLLPWMNINRCTFIYHYLAAYLFAILALAWLLDRGLSASRPLYRGLSFGVAIAIGVAFIYWLPIYLGLPLSQADFYQRMWFRSWI